MNPLQPVKLACPPPATPRTAVGCLILPRPRAAIDLLRGPLAAGWRSRSGGEPDWKLDRGVLEIVPGTGDIVTCRSFDDFQLHVEFWLPHMPEARGQDRANSGIYLQGRYELQLLDSPRGRLTAEDCGAIYSVSAPLHGASLPAGHWQSFDVYFRSARRLLDPRVTVVHNGVLVQNNLALPGPTPGALHLQERAGRGPILLQDHGAAVRFRNMWLLF